MEVNTHTAHTGVNWDDTKGAILGLVPLVMMQKDHLQHEKAGHSAASQSRHLGGYLGFR